MTRYAIHNADTKDALYYPSIKDQCDLVFADSPYNIGIAYGNYSSKDDSLPSREFKLLLDQWIEGMFNAARPGGVVAFLISERWADFTGLLMSRHGPRMNRVIWHEAFANYANAEKRLTNEHRHLFIHRKYLGDTVFNNDPSVRIKSARLLMGDSRGNPNGRMPGDVWVSPRLVGSHPWRVDWHKAQLHPAPLTRLVRIYSRPGDLVCDAFAGSGNLGVVCALEGRRFVGVERDGPTAQNIRRRVRSAYSKPKSVPAVDMSVMGDLV